MNSHYLKKSLLEKDTNIEFFKIAPSAKIKDSVKIKAFNTIKTVAKFCLIASLCFSFFHFNVPEMLTGLFHVSKLIYTIIGIISCFGWFCFPMAGLKSLRTDDSLTKGVVFLALTILSIFVPFIFTSV